MKQCNRCGESKALEEFQKRARNKDGYADMCKVCKRAYDNAHYKAHPDRRLSIRANSDKRIAEVQEWIRQYFAEHPCVDCGETDIVVLEFDHVSDKEQNIAHLMKTGNVASVQKEVAKCEVRCCNCHRRKTARTLGSWRIASLV